MAKLLEGGIAKLVAQGLKKAKMTMDATLIKVTPSTRGGTISAGTNPTEASFAAKGFVPDRRYDFIGGVQVGGNGRVYALLGATIASKQVPVANDKITIDGETFRLEAVQSDAARAVYLCLVRK